MGKKHPSFARLLPISCFALCQPEVCVERKVPRRSHLLLTQPPVGSEEEAREVAKVSKLQKVENHSETGGPESRYS